VEQLADGVFRLRGFPPDAINIYVIDDVLLDRLDRSLFHTPGDAGALQVVPLPLAGRKMHAHTDWHHESAD